ncbi:MAG TPA: tetratricopeptide repeat protein [Candidatus Dormibacteraeota bacterium]|nr:tetratricopeptide repeat protein [Candidatus Dormibacteraeota bacterium]
MKGSVKLLALFFLLVTTVRGEARQQAPTTDQQHHPSEAGSAQQAPPLDAKARSEAYYNLTMGHISEEMYQSTGRSEYAIQAIEFYKTAYALDPKSPVIGERLAEIYLKTQRIRDAVTEAQQILKRDPNDLPTRRLLARIYVRTLGDLSSVSGQSDSVVKALEQYNEILRIDPSDTEAALWLAKLYRLQNDREKAKRALRALLQRDPENEAGIEQLTQLLLDEGKSSDAIALLEGIVKRSPTPGLFDLLGDAYTQMKNPVKAEQAFRQAMELEPQEASHRRGLGQALIAQAKYNEALEQYKKISQIDPDDAETYLSLAKIYQELHQLDLAEKNLLIARQHSPGSPEVIYNEAMLYQSQGRYEDAIRVLSDAAASVKTQVTLTPSSRRTLAILYQQLGRLYREVERYPAALNTFQEMLKLGEDEDRRARVEIIETYQTAKDVPHALESARKALELYPRDHSIRVRYALLLAEKGDTDEAARMLREMLTGTEADREIQLDIAQVYQRGGRYAEAETAARIAEKLPGRPADKEMVWLILGAIFERQKMFDRAEEQFRRVLEINPRNAEVLNYYGYMLGDLGIRLDEAHALIKRALAEEPHNGAFLDSMGWVLYKQNRLPEAEEMLRKAISRNSHDATIHSHLGDVYFKSGRAGLAAAEWEKSLAEWRHALPSETEADKLAELEKKLTTVKRQLAQKKTEGAPAKPQ